MREHVTEGYTLLAVRAELRPETVRRGIEIEEAALDEAERDERGLLCPLYTSPSPRDRTRPRMPPTARKK